MVTGGGRKNNGARLMDEPAIKAALQGFIRATESATKAYSEFVAFWKRNPQLLAGVRRLDAELRAKERPR